MALSSTIYTFAIELSDMDRNVYESLDLKVARHPSETEEALVTRVLAYCCEYTEGIEFSKGISTPDDPAIAVRDLTGKIRTWIDIGAPDAARLHRASKSSDRVVVYTHKNPRQILANWAGERIHRADELALIEIPRELLDPLVAVLDRRMSFSLTITDGHLMAALDSGVFEGALTRFTADQPA